MSMGGGVRSTVSGGDSKHEVAVELEIASDLRQARPATKGSRQCVLISAILFTIVLTAIVTVVTSRSQDIPSVALLTSGILRRLNS